MYEIIDGERDRLVEEVSGVARRYPAVRRIDRTGGGNVGDKVSFEVWFEPGAFTEAIWKAVKADLRRVKLDRRVRRGRICHSTASGTTKSSKRRSAGSICRECGKPGWRVRYLEDGLPKHYNCCDIPPN